MSDMSDDELRRRIAEARGWKIYHYDKGPRGYYCLLDDDGYPVNYEFRENERATEAEIWEKDCPDWPNDLNAAFELTNDWQDWHMFNFILEEQRKYTVWINGKQVAQAATPARAISEAWLLYKAKEGQR
jgi:hypothetical protein